MKRTLRIALPILALIVVALVAAPFLIPLERFRGPIERAASEATGREVRIAGALRFTLYPDIGVGVEDVTIANVGNARDPVMISVANAVIGAKLIPLFSRRLEVTQITLQEPVIHLEIAADASNNWTFRQTEQAPPAEGSGSVPLDIGTLNLAIEDGLLTYYDARDGRDERFEDIDVALEREGAGKALTASGGLTRKDERLTLSASVTDPDALVEARDTQTTVSLASDVLNANFTGTMGATGNIAGDIKLGAPSLRALGAWAGISLPGENGLGLFALEGKVSADKGNYALSGIVMSFDAMRFSGDLGLDTRPDVPKLNGQLSVDKLDLNPYLGGGPATDAQAQPASAPAAGWSDDPISLTGLKAMDADLTLNVSGLAVRAFKIDAGTIGITLKGGVLDAALRSIALYGGTGSGALTVNASGATPTFRNTLDVSGVRVQALLADLLGVDRIEGTGSMRYSVTSQGMSQKAIIEALAGDGRINFADGRIRGVDLAQVARLVQSVISGQGLGNAVGGGASTDFAELGGSFTIRGGVMHNEDFRLLNPFVRMTGAGDVNLAARSLDFRLEPRAVASAQGQGGQLGAGGIGVPFRVSGPWTNLSYTPDLSGAARGLAEGLLQGQSPLDALTGRQQQNSNTGSTPPPTAPVQDLLKGLLGR